MLPVYKSYMDHVSKLKNYDEFDDTLNKWLLVFQTKTKPTYAYGAITRSILLKDLTKLGENGKHEPFTNYTSSFLKSITLKYQEMS